MLDQLFPLDLVEGKALRQPVELRPFLVVDHAVVVLVAAGRGQKDRSRPPGHLILHLHLLDKGLAAYRADGKLRGKALELPPLAVVDLAVVPFVALRGGKEHLLPFLYALFVLSPDKLLQTFLQEMVHVVFKVLLKAQLGNLYLGYLRNGLWQRFPGKPLGMPGGDDRDDRDFLFKGVLDLDADPIVRVPAVLKAVFREQEHEIPSPLDG